MAIGEAPITNKSGLRFGSLGDRWSHVCVDMQRMFRQDTEWRTPWMSRVLPEVVHLVELEPERTFFTRFVPAKSPQDAVGTWRRYYQRWSTMTLDRIDLELVNLVPELERFVPPAQVVDKRVYSPWIGTSLRTELATRGVDTLIVSGAETEVCVLATVIGAIDLGFRVIVATDAICSSADQTHDAMLEIYHNRYGMQVEPATVAEIAEARR
jgi:nicotinamidase-related amidase